MLFHDIENNLGPLQCPNDIDAFSRDVCNDFVLVFNSYNEKCNIYEHIIKDKLDTITSMCPVVENRDKRAVFVLALADFFTAGIKAINNCIQYKRTQSISKTVERLGRAHFKLADDYLDFKQDMTTVVNVNRKDIHNIKSEFKVVNHNLTVSTNHVETQFKPINVLFNILEKRVRAIKIVSTLTSKLFVYIEGKLSVYDNMIDYCDLIIDSMTTLTDNKLPRQLVTHPSCLTF